MQIVKKIKVGRSSSNDFVINNDWVSGRHAILSITDSGEVSISDRNSKNGTFVDGKRVTESTILKPGVIVRLGGKTNGTILDWQRVAFGDVKPPKTSKKYHLADAIETKRIGKEPENDICLPYSDVSRRHALLCKKQNGSVSIVDCDSTNGTFVNGIRIVGEKMLQSGDKVLIAKKYSLEWEKVYRVVPKIQIWKQLAGIAVAVAIFLILWPYEVDPADIYAMYKNSVVLIYQESGYRVTVNGSVIGDLDYSFSELNYCHVEDGEPKAGLVGGSGTGFFISNDGKIMTNRHVVSITDKNKEKEADIVKDGIRKVFVSLAECADNDNESGAYQYLAQKVEVEYVAKTYILLNDTHFNSKSDFIPCSVIETSQNDDLDVAIIQTDTKKTPVEKIVDLEKVAKAKDMEIGDKVYTIGFPQSFEIATTEIGIEANNQSGEITQERGEYTYGHNITIHQGASGSPVFDCRGRFAGIIVSGFLGISQGYNHAIHPQKAADFANQ